MKILKYTDMETPRTATGESRKTTTSQPGKMMITSGHTWMSINCLLLSMIEYDENKLCLFESVQNKKTMATREFGG